MARAGTLTSSNVQHIPDKWERLTKLYEIGAADVEIAKELGITIAKFRKLVKDNAQFATFVEHGNTLAMAYFYKIGRDGIFDKGFNTTLWAFNMKNRFGWADKVESTVASDEPQSADDMKNKVYGALRQLAKHSPEILRDLSLKDEPDEASK